MNILSFIDIGYRVESSFLELRCKEVVNVIDGKRLGHIIDIAFDLCSARMIGLIVPGEKTGWNIFKNTNQLFIPFGCISKIGEDTILVELPPHGTSINPYVLSQGKK